MNSFGHNFRITLFGESHGQVIGIVMDGVKPGMRLSAEDFSEDLARRRSGAAGTTPRREKDDPQIISGIFGGMTTGAPVTVLFANENTKPEDYAKATAHPRPSHADLTAARKYGGFNDPRGGGMFSGRMTAAMVAAGVVAKKMLPEVRFTTIIEEVGGCDDRTEFDEIIARTAEAGDSVGGVIKIVAENIPAGLGEPFFDSAESVISHLLFSIPAVKGVEFGAGFRSARSKGSENNDPIMNSEGKTATNNDGGMNGGITNGNPLVVRAAVKPAPSISLPQETFDLESGRTGILSVEGRHDACIAIRAAVVAEAAVAIALADLISR